jgi:transcription initiation factor TFIIB
LRDISTGELVCQLCGIVLSSDPLSREPEWRAFDLNQRERLARTGSPLNLTLHDNGLSTRIGWRSKSTPKQRAKMYRLRKWNRRMKVSKSSTRNLAQALSNISKISDKLKIPRNVVETASILYRKAMRKDLVKGRTILCIASACIYLACRQCKVSRSLNEVAEAANIEYKEVARNYRFIYNTLNVKVPQISRLQLISKFSSQLDHSGSVEIVARKLMEKSEEEKLTCGRGPAGVSAACIYISGKIVGENRTQSQIANIADVTEVTVRNRYKELLQELDLEISM